MDTTDTTSIDQELEALGTARTSFRARYAAAAQLALERFDALVEATTELRRLHDLALERFPGASDEPTAAGLPDLDFARHGLANPEHVRERWLKHAFDDLGQPIVAEASDVLPVGAHPPTGGA